MNIAIFSMSFKPDKNEANTIILRRYASALKEAGHGVYIICPEFKGYPLRESVDGFRVIRMKRRSGFYNELGLFKDGLAVAKEENGISNFNVIINNFASPILGSRTLMLKKSEPNAKYVAMVRSLSSRDEFLPHPRSYLWSFLLRHYDLVITPLESIKRKIVRKGVSATRVKVLRSPVDTDKFKPMDKEGLRSRYGLSGRIVLYYGHFKPVKGIEYLLEAISMIDGVSVFLIHSRDRLNSAYEDKIDRMVYKLGDRARILSYETPVVDYINMADCTCFPYPSLVSTEGNPSCILESMACGTPVVTTDLQELREFLKPGNDVVMAKPMDPKDLADKLRKVLEDDQLSKRLSGNGVKLGRSFDYMKLKKQFIDLIQSLVS